MAKYLFVTGSVISGCGKGVSAASIGLLLRFRGHNVTYIKFDPFHNINSGLLAPSEHGNVWVTEDGGETDLDLGHAESIMGINVTKANICTSGTLYKQLIDEQEEGKYLGETIQITPHITNLIQQRLIDLGKDHDIVIVEIGGTIGDNESFAFFEAIRQFKYRDGGRYREDVLVAVVAPILWVNTINEFKTKPLQNGIRELQRYGIQPDVIFCRVDRPVPEKILSKVADLTTIPRTQVFDAPDVSTIHQVPIEFYNRHVDDMFVDLFRLNRSPCRIYKYREVVEKYIGNYNMPTINVGIIGKYDNCDEAYLALKEALVHAGVGNNLKVSIKWIRAEDLEKYKDMRGLHKYFDEVDAIVVPGGFDGRGVEGKIRSIQYVREKKIPFLGICLGLQCAVIEFARNVCGMSEANSIEFNKDTPQPVIHFVKGQESITKKSGTMRLGAYDCELNKDSLIYELYGKKMISERHRHRYEVNDKYVSLLEEKGFRVVGRNPQSKLIEMMELDRSLHPFFVGTQAHPEYKSRLINPAPLFNGLVVAALAKKNCTDENKQQIIMA
jgi:CTP synthase